MRVSGPATGDRRVVVAFRGSRSLAGTGAVPGLRRGPMGSEAIQPDGSEAADPARC